MALPTLARGRWARRRRQFGGDARGKQRPAAARTWRGCTRTNDERTNHLAPFRCAFSRTHGQRWLLKRCDMLVRFCAERMHCTQSGYYLPHYLLPLACTNAATFHTLLPCAFSHLSLNHVSGTGDIHLGRHNSKRLSQNLSRTGEGFLRTFGMVSHRTATNNIERGINMLAKTTVPYPRV